MKSSTLLHKYFLSAVLVVSQALTSFSQVDEFRPVGDGEFEQRVSLEIEDNPITSSTSSIYWEVRQHMPDQIVYVYANDSVERININGIPYTQKIWETEYFHEGFIESIELPFWETGLIAIPGPIIGKQITIIIERRKIQFKEPLKK